MVILQINSNVPQDETSFAEFSDKVTETLAKQLDKNSSLIQVIFEYSKIAFGGQAGPSALVTISSTDLNRDGIEKITASLPKLLERSIGTPAPTTVIQFKVLDPSQTAWNGRLLK